MGDCRVVGCDKPREGFSVFCAQHKRRQRRHGSPIQKTVSSAQLQSYRDVIRRWLDGRPEEHGWVPLRLLFGHLLTEAHSALIARGASAGHLRQAHQDIVNVAGEGPEAIDQAILTVSAMFRMRHVDPTMFASDDGFRVQLARRFRAQTDLNVAESWNQAEGRSKRVYRDTSRRRLIALGQLLSVGLGPVALTILQTMERQASSKANERQGALERLRADT